MTTEIITKAIDLKNLNKQQKEIVRYLNQQILEHQHVFHEEPTELLVSKGDYKKLIDEEDNTYKYLTLGSKEIKIYSI